MRSSLLLGMVVAIGLPACASGRGRAAEGGTTAMGGTVARLTTPDLTRGWAEPARDAAAAVEMKYGPPAETRPHALVWGRSGQWQRTTVYEEPVPHAFPAPHARTCWSRRSGSGCRPARSTTWRCSTAASR